MVAPEPATDGLLSVIAQAARDPQVDPAKLEALLGLKERIDAKQAEIEFNRAFARLQLRMPRVKKNGTIDLGRGKPIPFAKWEDVDAVIRPILSEEGFAVSFTSKPTASGVLMTCVLTHEMGHSKTSEMQLPPDAGPGRNGLQAIGSSRSYGKRYLACDILNIVTEGADDNGNAAGYITETQVNRVYDKIAECEMTPDRQRKLLQYANAASVEQIQAHRFDDVMAQLEKAAKQKTGGAR